MLSFLYLEKLAARGSTAWPRWPQSPSVSCRRRTTNVLSFVRLRVSNSDFLAAWDSHRRLFCSWIVLNHLSITEVVWLSERWTSSCMESHLLWHGRLEEDGVEIEDWEKRYRNIDEYAFAEGEWKSFFAGTTSKVSASKDFLLFLRARVDSNLRSQSCPKRHSREVKWNGESSSRSSRHASLV